MKPASPDIKIRCQGADNEFVTVSAANLPQNAYDITYLLKLETAPRSDWLSAASAYFRHDNWSAGIIVLEEATSSDVESMLHGLDDRTSKCSRLDLLAALGGAYVMQAEACVHDSSKRAESLRKAAEIFSRADNFDMDYPAIWTARGWAEFHSGKPVTTTWFDHAMDNGLVLGAIGLAALYLNRPSSKPDSRRDPVALLVSAVRTKQCPPGVWTGLAYALYKEGRYASARDVAHRAVRAVQYSPPAERLEPLYLIALIEAADRSPKSIDCIALALAEAYDQCGGRYDTRILALIAHMHFSGGDFKKAEAFARQAVDAADLLPGASVGAMFTGLRVGARAEAMFQLARAQHHLSKAEDAMFGFEQVKSLCEGSETHAKINPGVLLRLGLLKLASGRKEDETMAQECLEKVLKLSNERCGIAKRALGVLIGRRVLAGLRKGRPRGGELYERAVSLLKKGLNENEESKKDVPAQLVYAGLVEEYHPKDALFAYRKAVAVLEEAGETVDPEVWNNLSSLLSRLGEVEEAYDISLKKISEEYSSDCTTIVYNRGRLAELCGKLEEAEKIYRGFKKGSPHYNEASIRIAVMLMAKPDGLEEAERLLKEAMEDRLTKPAAALFLSNLYSKKKNFAAAQMILETNRHECDYIALAFVRFMHVFLDGLEKERQMRFLTNHIGTPLINMLKHNNHNASAANGVGVYFAESKMMNEARDAFTNAGAGLNPEKVARVNLAHTQVLSGKRELHDSAKYNLRPSARAISNARGLYEQADRLYSDALRLTDLRGSKDEFQAHCELLLLSSWAQFEGRRFRSSADRLLKLVHLIPTSAGAWFNLGLALLEAAGERSSIGAARLAELELARDEFEGSRTAFQKSIQLLKGRKDTLTRAVVDLHEVQVLEKYVRQQAKTHDVKLRNAKDKAEDLEKKRLENIEMMKEMERKKIEKKMREEYERKKKEEELLEAFEASQRKQKELEEEYAQQLRDARRHRDDDEDDSGEENGGTPGPTKSRKRKKKEDSFIVGDDEKIVTKKARRQGSAKKKVTEDSASEYSDVGEDGGEGTLANGMENGEKNSPTRRNFALATDPNDADMSDAGF